MGLNSTLNGSVIGKGFWCRNSYGNCSAIHYPLNWGMILMNCPAGSPVNCPMNGPMNSQKSKCRSFKLWLRCDIAMRSQRYKAHGAIHGAIHDGHRAIQSVLIGIHRVIHRPVQTSLNRYEVGSK